MLRDFPVPAVQVCGPITTGGKGSFEDNMEVLHHGIHWVAGQGKVVFDQRPFQYPMLKVIAASKKSGYPHDLLEEFFLPLFLSGYIGALYFLPGWETSVGSNWEFSQGKGLGLEIRYIPVNFMDTQ